MLLTVALSYYIGFIFHRHRHPGNIIRAVWVGLYDCSVRGGRAAVWPLKIHPLFAIRRALSRSSCSETLKQLQTEFDAFWNTQPTKVAQQHRNTVAVVLNTD